MLAFASLFMLYLKRTKLFNTIIFGLVLVIPKSGQIGFLFQKDAQCSETYEKTIFRLFIYNNCTTKTKITYVLNVTGLLPAWSFPHRLG